jgi:hypothetical protein
MISFGGLFFFGTFEGFRKILDEYTGDRPLYHYNGNHNKTNE